MQPTFGWYFTAEILGFWKTKYFSIFFMNPYKLRSLKTNEDLQVKGMSKPKRALDTNDDISRKHQNFNNLYEEADLL